MNATMAVPHLPPERPESTMQRVTLTLDDDLVAEFETFMKDRGYQSRSEAFRDVVRAGFHELGSEPGTAVEKDVRAFLAAETKKWAEVIRLSGAKVD